MAAAIIVASCGGWLFGGCAVIANDAVMGGTRTFVVGGLQSLTADQILSVLTGDAAEE